MGYDIAWRTTEQISPALQREITESFKNQTAGRTWMSGGPPDLAVDDGYLHGSSRPRWDFSRTNEDVASALKEGLPDGTVNDLLACLCRISAEFDIEWEFRDDYSEGPIGYIRCGECDDDVRRFCDGLTGMGEDLRGLGLDPDEY